MVNLVDAAVWLLGQHKNTNVIEVIIHPRTGVPTLGFLVDNFKRRYVRKPKDILRAIYRRFFQRKPNVTGSIFHCIYKDGQRVCIATTIGQIKICKSPSPLVRDLGKLIGVYRSSYALWRACFKGKGLQPKKFLELKYFGTEIGDLLASHALREDPSNSGGSLKACTKLFQALLDGVAVCDYIRENVEVSESSTNVFIGEPTYIQGIYNRALHARGATILDKNSYCSEYWTIPACQEFSNPRVVYSPSRKPLTPQDCKVASEYLTERIGNPASLGYMTVGWNKESARLYDDGNRPIFIGSEELYVVLFLHSFDDAQYWFGVDGFDDIFHWTMFTIEHLLANTDISRVLIKTHPNVNYENYPGDKIAVERIRVRFSDNSKISWLKSNCSPKTIARYGKPIGVTHHGSIAEELVYLGVPVIASSFAPWSESYCFVNTWNNPQEYAEKLKAINLENRDVPDETSQKSLIRFIHDYRLSGPVHSRRTAWIKFARWLDGKECGYDQQTWARYSEKFAALKPDSEILRNYLNHLIIENEITDVASPENESSGTQTNVQ